MEAVDGLTGRSNGPPTELPVLAEGKNLGRNGLRCSADNGGVACGNVCAGIGFFGFGYRYELITQPAESASPAPAEAPKTP